MFLSGKKKEKEKNSNGFHQNNSIRSLPCLQISRPLHRTPFHLELTSAAAWLHRHALRMNIYSLCFMLDSGRAALAGDQTKIKTLLPDVVCQGQTLPAVKWLW